MKRKYGEIDSMQSGGSRHLPRVHDGTGDSGLAMHRPGFRVTDAPLSDELQRAHDAYEHNGVAAWRERGRRAGCSKGLRQRSFMMRMRTRA
jgi:hypothetical protein